MSGSTVNRRHSDPGYPSAASASSSTRVTQGGALRGSSRGGAPSQPPPRANVGSSAPIVRRDPQDALAKPTYGSDDCEQPLPQPTAIPAQSRLGVSVHDQGGSDDCEQPLPQPTTSISDPTNTSDPLDGSDECEQPLPQPNTPTAATLSSRSATKDRSDDCEQPLPQPAIHTHTPSADHSDADDSSDGCEQPLPQPTTTPARLRPSVSIHDQDDPDDCDQPLPQPTAPIPILTDPSNAQDGSDDCEQPLPQPSTPIVVTPASPVVTKGGSDDCVQTLSQPPLPILPTQAGRIDVNDGFDDRSQPLRIPPLRHTPTGSPSSAAIATTAHKPTAHPRTSLNVFLRVPLRPFCADDATPVSVEGVEGVFCVSGFYICSSHRADGACPDAQPGLPDGSHCGIVRTRVFGCRPGPQPQ